MQNPLLLNVVYALGALCVLLVIASYSLVQPNGSTMKRRHDQAAVYFECERRRCSPSKKGEWEGEPENSFLSKGDRSWAGEYVQAPESFCKHRERAHKGLFDLIGFGVMHSWCCCCCVRR